MQANHSMKTELFFKDSKQARIALKAIEPDLRNSFNRSKSVVFSKENNLTIKIKASDLTALRASFNSIMKGIVVSGKILNSLQ